MSHPAIPVQEAPHRTIVGPWADLLVLGGGSVIAFAIFQAIHLDQRQIPMLALVMLLLANFVNHPHFAHSYQLFYGNWSSVKTLPKALRIRWWFAGVFAPLLLTVLLVSGAMLWQTGTRWMLGAMLSLMGLLVGWHYVKQGFGMAMTDAALKRRYWPANARRALLVNAYSVWGASWALANLSGPGREFWGVAGVTLPSSTLLVTFLAAVTLATSAWTGLVAYRCIQTWRAEGLHWRHWPVAGLMAYVVTLYLWTLFASIDPAFAFVIPFFHSIQYLAVIWRYKINEAKALAKSNRDLARFAAIGVLLGALGFWILPGLLEMANTGQWPDMTGGSALAIACAWIFINIHHYLIDNAIWRQGNPGVARYLFGSAR